MSNEHGDLATRRQKEKEKLIALHARCPKTDKDFPYTGVLLDDGISYCVHTFDMIRPFDPANLKPANYKLTIGDQYAMDGEIHELSDHSVQGSLTIPPFQVAVIKTRETINMPKFLIARWNIRVQLAYKGLLWVGGPQVDAGYVGNLFCPVYNLSNKAVKLNYGEPIAVIDFVRTSTFNEGKSTAYKDVPPERILFEDYAPQELNSALYEIATTRLEKVEQRTDSTEKGVAASLRDIQVRVDTFVLVTFGVLAILFAAITVSSFGKESPPWQYISIFLLSGFAIFFAGSAWVKSKSEGKLFGRAVQAIVVVGLLVSFLVQLGRVNGQRAQIEELNKKVHALEVMAATDKGPVTPAAPSSQPAAPKR